MQESAGPQRQAGRLAVSIDQGEKGLGVGDGCRNIDQAAVVGDVELGDTAAGVTAEIFENLHRLADDSSLLEIDLGDE